MLVPLYSLDRPELCIFSDGLEMEVVIVNSTGLQYQL